MRQRWLSRRALLLHLALCIWFPGCLIAGWWQVHRALSGNTLSYLYSIEWPAFAIAGVYAWWLLVHIDATTPGRSPAEQLTAARHAAAAAAAARRSDAAAARSTRGHDTAALSTSRHDPIGDLLVAQRQAAAVRGDGAPAALAGAGGPLTSPAQRRHAARRPRPSPTGRKRDERREREVDEELAAYNARLARLATDGAKTWRQP